MKPDDLLEKLKDTASPRASSTLDTIYEICMEQKHRGLDDFSVATIARLGHKRGVPKAQSLRNKTGKIYRALISSFEENHRGAKTRVEARTENDWIEEIENPKHMLLARIQAAELAAANKKLRDFVPPGTRIEVRDYQNENVAADSTLSDVERRALKHIISDEFLGEWGFSIGEDGEIVDGTGTVVFKIATVDAVKKVLACL